MGDLFVKQLNGFGQDFVCFTLIPLDKVNSRFNEQAVIAGDDKAVISQLRDVGAVSDECVLMYSRIRRYVSATGIACYVVDFSAKAGIKLEVPGVFTSVRSSWTAFSRTMGRRTAHNIIYVRDVAWHTVWKVGDKRAFFVYDASGMLCELHVDMCVGATTFKNLGSMVQRGLRVRAPSPARTTRKSTTRVIHDDSDEDEDVSLADARKVALQTCLAKMYDHAYKTANEVVIVDMANFINSARTDKIASDRYTTVMKDAYKILKFSEFNDKRVQFYTVIYILHHHGYTTAMYVFDCTSAVASHVYIPLGHDDINIRMHEPPLNNTACFCFDGENIYMYRAGICGLFKTNARDFETKCILPYVNKHDAYWKSQKCEIVLAVTEDVVGENHVHHVSMPPEWHTGVYNQSRCESIKLLMAHLDDTCSEVQVDDYMNQKMYTLTKNRNSAGCIQLQTELEVRFEIFLIDARGRLNHVFLEVSSEISPVDTPDSIKSDERVPELDFHAPAVESVPVALEIPADTVNPEIFLLSVSGPVLDSLPVDAPRVLLVGTGSVTADSVHVTPDQSDIESSEDSSSESGGEDMVYLPLAVYFAVVYIVQLRGCNMYIDNIFMDDFIHKYADERFYSMDMIVDSTSTVIKSGTQTVVENNYCIEWVKPANYLYCSQALGYWILNALIHSHEFRGINSSLESVFPACDDDNHDDGVDKYVMENAYRVVHSETFRASLCAVWYIHDVSDTVLIVRSGDDLSTHVVTRVLVDQMLGSMILSTRAIRCVIFSGRNVFVSEDVVPPCSVFDYAVDAVKSRPDDVVVAISRLVNDDIDFWSYVKVWCLWRHCVVEPTNIHGVLYKYRVSDYAAVKYNELSVEASRWVSLMICLFKMPESALCLLLHKYDQRRSVRTSIGEYAAYLICEESGLCCVVKICGAVFYKFDMNRFEVTDTSNEQVLLKLCENDLLFILRSGGRLYEVLDKDAPILLRNYSIEVFPELSAAPSALTMRDLYHFGVLGNEDYIIWDEMYIQPGAMTSVCVSLKSGPRSKKWVSRFEDRFDVSDEHPFIIVDGDERKCVVRKSTHTRQDVYMNRHGATLMENMHDYLCAYVGWLDEYGVC